MTMLETIQSLDLRGKIAFNKSLATLTRFRSGGPAEIFYTPVDEYELSYFLRNLPLSVPVTILGNGSNVLIRDNGIPGVVIKLGKSFAYIKSSQDYITVGGATLNWTLTQKCLEMGIANFEFMEWIPGSVGGSVRMNAGSYGSEIGDMLLSIKAIDRSGKVHTLAKPQISFGYRCSDIPKDWLITEATFFANKKPLEQIKSVMQDYRIRKKNTQPIYARTCGSTFINPSTAEKKAWQYIEAVGGRNKRVGDAIWSSQHLNFAINLGNATSQNIEDLISYTREEIYAKFGLVLKLEVEILG